MYKDQVEAIRRVKEQPWSWHKKSSVIGQVKGLHGNGLAEYLDKLFRGDRNGKVQSL